jgi:transcriptional regulator with XRE-family HTH domain
MRVMINQKNPRDILRLLLSMTVLLDNTWAARDERRVASIEPIYKAIGMRIARLRESRDLTQEELGKKLELPPRGLTRAAISNIESGRQRLLVHTLFAIARALQVEPQDLLPSQEAPSTEKLEKELARLGLSKRVITQIAREVSNTPEDT